MDESRAPAWRRYLRFWGANATKDVDDEFRFHLEMRVAQYRREIGVRRFDPATYLIAIIIVSVACLIAVWQPSRRAARVDPATTLRD